MTPKITISSKRVDYKELSLDGALTVHHNIALYQSTLQRITINEMKL